MVPLYMPLLSIVLESLYHRFCSVIFHTGFSQKCLLPALVNIFQISFYCWSLSCISACLCGCPLESQRCHATWYYLLALLSCNMHFLLLMSARRSGFNGEHLAPILSVFCNLCCFLFLPVSPTCFVF